MRRALVVLSLVLFAADARADMPAGPWPWSKRAGPSINRLNDPPPNPDPAPQPPPPPIDPATGKELFDTREKPKRTGPFRSCGSGMGVGLAGIGAAWGMLWLGMRFVRSQRAPSTRT